MTVAIPIDALLALAEETGVVPFVVRGDVAPRGELGAAVRSAIDSANLAAEARVPEDPSWCAGGDVVADEVQAELAKGRMDRSEVRAWFADFAAALGDLAVIVAPLVPDPALLDLDDWRVLPPAVTAFIHFTVPGEPRLRELPEDAVAELSEALVAWSRLPGATTIARKGTAFAVIPPGGAGAHLQGPELGSGYGLWQVLRSPRRGRFVEFGTMGRGTLQVVDESKPAVSTLPDVLSGLRIVAPYLDYGWVRRAVTAAPNDLDMLYALKRPPTPAEDLATQHRSWHLLDSYVPDAYVAQVLTARHLERAGALESFSVEELGNERFLVTVRDPVPWLTGLDPEPAVLEEARRELGPALLTDEVLVAHPWRG